MKKFYCGSGFFFIIFFWCLSLYAQQTFERIVQYTGNSYINAATSTPDGNILLAGWIQNIGANTNGLLLKVDSSGTVLWSKSIGVSGALNLKSITVESNGRIVCCGEVSALNEEIFIGAFSAEGEPIWNGVYYYGQQSYPAALISVSDGYILCGLVIANGSIVHENGLLLKFDTLGNILWQQELSSGDNATSIGLSTLAERLDHSLCIAGERVKRPSGRFSEPQQLLSMEFSPGGSLRHAYLFSDSTMDIVPSTETILADNSILIGGGTLSVDDASASSLLLRLDPDHSIRWHNQFSMFSSDNIHQLIELKDGTIIASTQTLMLGTNPAPAHLLEIEPNGILSAVQEVAALQGTFESMLLEESTKGQYLFAGGFFPDSIHSSVGIGKLTPAFHGCNFVEMLAAATPLHFLRSELNDITVSEASLQKLNEPISVNDIPILKTEALCSENEDITIASKINEFSVFPNPLRSAQTLTIRQPDTPLKQYIIVLKDMLAKEVYRERVLNNAPGDLIHLPLLPLTSGLYILQIIDADRLTTLWEQTVITY